MMEKAMIRPVTRLCVRELKILRGAVRSLCHLTAPFPAGSEGTAVALGHEAKFC